MSGIRWDNDNLPSLGIAFLQKVRDNMRGRPESFVRLGETGTGVIPNYEVCYPSGVTRPIRGSTHEGFDTTEKFAVLNLSKKFFLADIDDAIRKSRGG